MEVEKFLEKSRQMGLYKDTFNRIAAKPGVLSVLLGIDKDDQFVINVEVKGCPRPDVSDIPATLGEVPVRINYADPGHHCRCGGPKL